MTVLSNLFGHVANQQKTRAHAIAGDKASSSPAAHEVTVEGQLIESAPRSHATHAEPSAQLILRRHARARFPYSVVDVPTCEVQDLLELVLAVEHA